MTPIACHRPGTAWGKAWTRPPSSTTGSDDGAKTTPEVPSVSAIVPASTAPTPTACAAWSPPPATTGVPAFKPVASAASAEISPVTSGPSCVGGSLSAGISRASSTSFDQSRARTSKRSVPPAPALSVAKRPVRR